MLDLININPKHEMIRTSVDFERNSNDRQYKKHKLELLMHNFSINKWCSGTKKLNVKNVNKNSLKRVDI